MIEIMRFRLSSTTQEGDFLQADRAVQQDFAYHQRGLMRRTTARDGEGNWIVIDIWRSEADADRCATKWDSDPIAQRFMQLVDSATTTDERYTELE